MKKVAILILDTMIIGMGLNAKNMHKVFGTDDKIIKTASTIHVYKIEAIPILSVEQIQGMDYLYDYPIDQTFHFKRKAAAELITSVLDTTQYIYNNVRSCPFMGMYAVNVIKGNRSLTLIISVDPCPKAIIFCPGSIINRKHIDLIDKSRIIVVLEKLTSGAELERLEK